MSHWQCTHCKKTFNPGTLYHKCEDSVIPDQSPIEDILRIRIKKLEYGSGIFLETKWALEAANTIAQLREELEKSKFLYYKTMRERDFETIDRFHAKEQEEKAIQIIKWLIEDLEDIGASKSANWPMPETYDTAKEFLGAYEARNRKE
jgi:hypothetical protein